MLPPAKKSKTSRDTPDDTHNNTDKAICVALGPIVSDALPLIAHYIEPDPVKFRLDGDVRIFFDACRHAANMSMVCATWAAFTKPLMTKGHYDPSTKRMRFFVTSRGKRMACMATFCSFENPYNRNGTKKRLVDYLWGIMRGVFPNPTTMSFKDVQLPDTTFGKFVLKECAYEEDKLKLQGNTTQNIDIQKIQARIVRQTDDLWEVSKFITRKKWHNGSYRFVVRVAVATQVHITDENYDERVMQFWDDAPRLVRTSMRHWMSWLNPETSSRQTAAVKFRDDLSNKFANHTQALHNCEETERLTTETQELACSVYEDETNTNVTDMLEAMHKICSDRGVWINWLKWA